MKYKIDYFAFSKKILPYFLRKTKIDAILKSLIKPLQTINNKFNDIKLVIDFKLAFNSQIIYFEKYLNDVYLVSEIYPNNIHIIDKSNIDFFYLWNDYEQQVDEFFYNYEEGADPVYLANLNDYQAFNVSFIVNVPLSVKSGVDFRGQPFSEVVLKKRINEIRLAGKTFEIVYF